MGPPTLLSPLWFTLIQRGRWGREGRGGEEVWDKRAGIMVTLRKESKVRRSIEELNEWKKEQKDTAEEKRRRRNKEKRICRRGKERKKMETKREGKRMTRLV
jgi:hypothetical protein